MRLVSPDLWPILTIVGEAEGEEYAGKLMVGEVLRERASQKYNCDGTIESACLSPQQFSCWNTHDPGRMRVIRADQSRSAIADCVKAWNEAKAGSQTAHGALLYFNPSSGLPTPKWIAGCVHLGKIGKHDLYKPKPAN